MFQVVIVTDIRTSTCSTNVFLSNERAEKKNNTKELVVTIYAEAKITFDMSLLIKERETE